MAGLATYDCQLMAGGTVVFFSADKTRACSQDVIFNSVGCIVFEIIALPVKKTSLIISIIFLVHP